MLSSKLDLGMAFILYMGRLLFYFLKRIIFSNYKLPTDDTVELSELFFFSKAESQSGKPKIRCLCVSAFCPAHALLCCRNQS